MAFSLPRTRIISPHLLGKRRQPGSKLSEAELGYKKRRPWRWPNRQKPIRSTTCTKPLRQEKITPRTPSSVCANVDAPSEPFPDNRSPLSDPTAAFCLDSSFAGKYPRGTRRCRCPHLQTYITTVSTPIYQTRTRSCQNLQGPAVLAPRQARGVQWIRATGPEHLHLAQRTVVRVSPESCSDVSRPASVGSSLRVDDIVV